MEIRGYIHESLEKLKQLGIDCLNEEEDIAREVLSIPENMLADMDFERIFGRIIGSVGRRLCAETGSKEMYMFAVEVEEVSDMYTRFLEGISRLAEGELTITNIKEIYSEQVFEAGTGIQPVYFSCNGKNYQYDAKFEYDWFDAGMLTFMDKVIEEQNTGKHLYVTGDGGQQCIVFYRTEEWAGRFYELLQIELEHP